MCEREGLAKGRLSPRVVLPLRGRQGEGKTCFSRVMEEGHWMGFIQLAFLEVFFF